MKKLITSLFVIVAMMLPLMTQAQTHYNVVVGSQGTTNGYVPNYTYYNYSFSQNIIPANSISLSGVIDTLWYYVNSGSATRGITVSMAEMGKSSFSSSTDVIPTSAFTQVYAGSITWSTGWVGIPLDTPFDYQDTANLIIMVRDSTGSYVSSQQFSGSNGSANVSLYQYQDSGPCSPEVAGSSKGTSAFTPYMRIGISSYDVYCTPLDGISMSSVTAYDAIANIDEGGYATAWDVIVSDSAITDFESAYYTTTYSEAYSISGLDPNTRYYVYARANCGSSVSGWFGPAIFTTACAGTTNVPYSQDFEGLATGEIPNCWMQFATGSSSACSNFPCAYAHAPNARNSQIYFEMESSSGETEIIALPEMDNISALELDFYYGTSSSLRPILEVGVMEDTAFVVVDTVDITASTSITNYVPARVLFGNYTGSGNRIAMRTTKSGNYTLFIEDLEVINAPTCNTMPGSVSIVSLDSAECTLSWGAAVNQFSYAVYIANDSSWVNVYDSTVVLTGLNPNTLYTGKIYHICAAGDSSYSVNFSFRTDCGAMALPYTETFEGQTSGTPSCWTVI
ncbi:MAG: fibronectin type III domain-containing protein, partial [Bacteroidales bacterium]|nr:fibronectin type III domain-containing protein [Bacteroidales bacterium]